MRHKVAPPFKQAGSTPGAGSDLCSRSRILADMAKHNKKISIAANISCCDLGLNPGHFSSNQVLTTGPSRLLYNKN